MKTHTEVVNEVMKEAIELLYEINLKVLSSAVTSYQIAFAERLERMALLHNRILSSLADLRDLLKVIAESERNF